MQCPLGTIANESGLASCQVMHDDAVWTLFVGPTVVHIARMSLVHWLSGVQPELDMAAYL